MGKKLNTNIFIERSYQVHGSKYDYSKVEYIGGHKKVCIICPEHGEFWQDSSNHLMGQGCPKCSIINGHKKQSNLKEGFIEKSKQIHGDRYDYSKIEYVNNSTKVCIICPEHGEFWQKPLKHTQGQGCPYCGGTKKLTTKEFVEKSKQIHGDKYDYSKVDYISSETKVCIICPEHGEFWQTPHAHLSGQRCPNCFGNIKLTNGEFVKRSKEIHGDKYDYSKVSCNGVETKVCIICPEHGEFWQKPHMHLNNQGCPNCNTSKNSKIVQKVENKLNELKITYEKEKTFDWLVNKSHMYLDFFLPEYNVAIECHGIQHFKSVDFFGGDLGFEEICKRDNLKFKLCSENGIKIYYFADIDSDYFEKIYCNEDLMIKEICRQK